MKQAFACLSAATLLGILIISPAPARAADEQQELAQKIFDTMVKVHGVQQNARLVHAKGIVCKGIFEPSADAPGLSAAAQFQKAVPVTVRFSQGSPDTMVPDSSPNAGPQGMAIRFALPEGGESDIVANSHNGFVVAVPQDFLALQEAIAGTDPTKPHPWPVEDFLASHPIAAKFVQDATTAHPASFANEAFFGNNAFVFTNKDGKKQPGRYRIEPVAGVKQLSDAEAKEKPADYLTEDVKTRLASGPVQFKLIVQLPDEGDVTKDPSIAWPDDRKTIQVGTITVQSVLPDSAAAEKALAFDPMNLGDGIDVSDDPFPSLRSAVYALSAKRRHAKD